MGAVAHISASPNESAVGAVAVFYPLGSCAAMLGQGSENLVQIKWRTAGTLSKASVCIRANTDTGSATGRVRKNTANGNQVISITAATTGHFQDLVNTDTVAASDLFAYSLIRGAANTLTPNSFGTAFEASGGAFVARWTHYSGSVLTDTRFHHLAGGTSPQTLESLVETSIRCDGTLSNGGIWLSANTRDGIGTYQLRLDAADASIVTTSPAATTGWFEDLVNTQAVTADQRGAWSVVPGGSSGLITLRATCLDYTTTGRAPFATANFNGVNAGTTMFAPIAGTGVNWDTAEADTEAKALTAHLLSGLICHITANSDDGIQTLRPRINNANGTQVVSIGATLTGWFVDTTNSDTVAATDVLNYSRISAGGSGTSTWRSIGMAAGLASSVLTVTALRVVVTAPPVVTIGPEVLFVNDTSQIGLHWVEHLTQDDVTHVWSKYMLPDPASYYGGEKLDKVTEWKSIRRSLSDRRGQYVGVVYGYVLADDDHALRTIAADDVTQYLINNPTVVRSIPDDDRRALLTPRTIVRGVVREIQPLSPLLFGVTCEDWLSKRFRLGNNERQIPPRLIKDDIPTAPDASLEMGVPIIYGALSDQDSQTTQVGTALAFDSSIAAITSVGCHDVSGGTIPAGRVTAIVTGVLAGEEGPVSNAAGTNHTSAPRTVRVGWNSNSFTYDSYRIYLFEGMLGDWTPHGGVRSGVTVEWVRMLTHNTTPGGGDWGSGAWKEFGVDFTSLTDGTDALTGVLSTTVDQGHGVVAPIYVGVEEVSGTNYHKFVVAGHACKAIDELYVDGVAQNIATDSSQAGAGGIWLIPGYAGWTAEFGATVYELINGRRYTVIYGKAGQYGPDRGSGDVPNTEAGFDPSLVAPLTLNLKGIESTGDGTGTLITKVIDQMYHFAVNYVAQDYAGLDWASVPTFADDATLPLVDLASFNAADAIGDTQISGGIVGAGMFADPITLREAFARFAVSTGIRYGFNRKTQLAAFKLSDDPDLTVAPHYTQELDILKDSFHLRTVQDDWANEVPYAFGRNHALNKWGTESTIQDSESITNFGETKVLEQQTYWFLHDAAIASDVASRELIWRRIPPNVVTLETALRGLNDDHGDYIRITHTSGLGANGWTEQPTWIVRHEVDPDRNKVWLELEDIARYVGSPELGGGAAVMGDEATMAETWLTATDADKAFAYMADATTGQFTDGALGKELR